MTSRFLRAISAALPPAGMLLLVVGLWQLSVMLFQIKQYLLPAPGGVLTAAWEMRSALLKATQTTFLAAACGFTGSLLAGVLIGFVFSQSPTIRRSCYPYAILLQTVPVVAIAPLIIIWLNYGFLGVVLVSMIVSLFPVITNATDGLTSIPPDLVDLFRMSNASRGQFFWKLRLPNAVPSIVTGARTSAGLAVIGAIVGEFFVGGGSFGLGYLVKQKSEQLKTAELFAVVIASMLLGLAIFTLVNLSAATLLRRWTATTN